MALNTDRSGEELQVMTYDAIIAAVAGDIDVTTYSTVMFDAPVLIDGGYSLAANIPLGIKRGRESINIDTNCGMMVMWR